MLIDFPDAVWKIRFDILMKKILNSIRQQEQKDEMKRAAEILYNDYMNDKKLTIFTNLDGESFYESK